MKRRSVVLLKSDRLDVVSLCLFKLANFVPAEGSVVKGFEMLPIQLNGPGIVKDGILVFPLLPVSETSIVVEVCFGALKFDRLGETIDRLIEVPFAIETDSLVVVSKGVVGVDANRS